MINKRAQINKGCALFLLALCFGLNYANFSAQSIFTARIPSSFDQQTIHVTAFLCSLPRKGDYSFSADFCLLDVQSSKGELLSGRGFKAKLRWPLELELSTGVSLLDVKSRQVKSTRNFIGTSFENNLLYQRIVLMGDVKKQMAGAELDSLRILDRLKYEYHQLRHSLSQRINYLLRDTTHKGVIGALLLGDRSMLSPEDAQVLANTGTQHLIAISGLHVGLVIFGMFYFLPRTVFSILTVSILGLFYVALVGFTPSAQRAWVMCVCALFYLSGYIKQSKWWMFFLALFLVLLLDPLSTLNLGFWYSFLCVAIIFLIFQLTTLNPQGWLSLITFQFVLIIAMTPLSSILGTKHGLENMLANVFAIPWVSLVVLPFSLGWFLVSTVSEALAEFLLVALDMSIELLSAYLSSLKLFHIPITIEIYALIMICFGLGVMALLVFNKVKSVFAMSALALALVIVFPSRFYDDTPEFMVFDVGQGLALAMKSEGKVWLYDTGPAFDKSSSVKNVLLPYLRRHQKSNQLQGVILSHGDADHAGDLVSLHDEFKPMIAWSGQPERLSLSGFNHCQTGMKWREADFELEVLYPFPETDISQLSSNNQSCIIRLSMMGKIFLLMGDIEAQTEMDVVKHYRHKLKADVLIAGHHGASKSSSFALLKHVQPDYIVFSAGYLNKFGHPSVQVLDRVATFSSMTLNTSSLGAIKFRAGGYEFRSSAYQNDGFVVNYARE